MLVTEQERNMKPIQSTPRGKLTATVLIFLTSLTASADTLYVWQGSSFDQPPYANWTTAARTIQDAVDAAQEGDIVLVTNGVYAIGGRQEGFMTNRVTIRKRVIVTSVNGPQLTVIQGAQAPGGGNGNGAVRCVWLSDRAVLSGFTLTSGATRGASGETIAQRGGGVWCAISTVVSNCVVVGNSASDYGGGAYGEGTFYNCTFANNSASVGGGAALSTLYNCTLSGNSAFSGGGAYAGTLYNCTVSGNSATNHGGGLYSGALYNCILTGNTAQYGGGARESILRNCLLTDNSAGSSGGGVTGGTLHNCTLTGNSAGESGGGAWQATLHNCIVHGNTANVAPELADSDCHTCWTDTPVFVNPGAGDYHLLSNSPCIDAGTNLSTVITNDLDGHPRPWDGNGDGIAAFDIGAYEFVNGPPVILVQPRPRTNVVGSSLMLSVTATGLDPLTYQWFKNGAALQGANGRTHVLTDVQLADAGTYAVRVSHLTGFLLSSNAELTVVSLEPPPVIAGPIVNPANDHQYYLLGQSTWVEAEAAAQSLGGHLTTLRNAGEQEWVFAQFSAWGGQERILWIGLHDADPVNNAIDSLERRAEFVWASDEPVTYGNWSAVEPNNYRERGEYYIHTLPPSDPSEPGAWVDAWDVDFNGRPLHGVAEVAPPSTAVTHYVNTVSPTPTAPYLTWETAARTIQEAVDAAVAGDIVLVTNGVYATGGRTVVGTMTNRVVVDKPLTVQSINGPQFTVIEGWQVPHGRTGDGAIRCVYLTNQAILYGFTLTNGATRRSGDSSEQSGGGVSCEGANAVVSRCVIMGNAAIYGGGASGGTFYTCTFSGNSAGWGGGTSSAGV
jgi:parallel beta-helix repeat protein